MTSIFLLAGILYALAYNISGVVTDTDGDALVGASLRLLRSKDSTVIKAAAADGNGRYVLRDIADGRYVLEASYVATTDRQSMSPWPDEHCAWTLCASPTKLTHWTPSPSPAYALPSR